MALAVQNGKGRSDRAGDEESKEGGKEEDQHRADAVPRLAEYQRKNDRCRGDAGDRDERHHDQSDGRVVEDLPDVSLLSECGGQAADEHPTDSLSQQRQRCAAEALRLSVDAGYGSSKEDREA